MLDLSECRRKIDEIDAQLIPLLEERMKIVQQVAAYKKAHQMPVYQADREQQVLEKAVKRLQDPKYTQEAMQFMNMVMAISRSAQNRTLSEQLPQQSCIQQGKVGFYGPSGSFTEQAAIHYFDAGRMRTAYAEFEEIFEALQKKEIAYGVLPIENSSTGAISQVYDLLGRYGFYIVGEVCIKIRQNLIAADNATLESIRTVYSHPQGMEQSSSFLRQHPDWKLIPFHSTSESARMVAQEKNPTHAAIAGVQAAEAYGLQVLVSDIQNNSENSTRFIIIGRVLEPKNADKISIMFSLDNESGTLYRTLRYFADHHINLVKIESRPIPQSLWNYLFYLDFEGDLNSARVQHVLQELTAHSGRYKLLGAYRSSR